MEEYRVTQDLEALRRQLLADGYKPRAVYQAIAQVYGSVAQGSGASPAPAKPLRYYLLIIGILFVNLLVLPVLIKYVYEAQGWSPPLAPPYVAGLLAAPAEWLLALALRKLAVPAWLSPAIFGAVLVYLMFLPVWVRVYVMVIGQFFAG